jgi:hypothetical protein
VEGARQPLTPCTRGECALRTFGPDGYPLELIAQLVETGLATAESEWIIPIDSTVSAIRIKITESGRLALEGP